MKLYNSIIENELINELKSTNFLTEYLLIIESNESMKYQMLHTVNDQKLPLQILIINYRNF